MGAQAELQRGDREHAAELAGAENADGRAGAEDHRSEASSAGRSATSAVRAARQASSRRQRGVGERQHGGRQQRGVDRARFADRERADRNAGRHLDDREEAVLARERFRGDRHAEHRQRGEGRGHARQMRRAARAGDDDLEARGFRAPWRRRSSGRAFDGRRRSAPHSRRRASSRVSAARRMIGQSDWLPMMMATGFGAPLTGARRGPNRRDLWSLRLKEGRGARKRSALADFARRRSAR